MKDVDRSLEALNRSQKTEKRKKRREEESKKKNKRKQERREKEERLDELEEQSNKDYEKILKRRKQRRKDAKELEDKARGIIDEHSGNPVPKSPKEMLKEVGKTSGILQEKQPKEEKKPIFQRMIHNMKYSTQRQKIEDKINKKGHKITLGFLNKSAQKATGDKDIEVNLANIASYFPQAEAIMLIAALIMTFFFWVLFFIPLLIVIFGLVIILLILLDKSGDMEVEGLDYSGVDVSGITLEGTIGGGGGGNSEGSKTATMGKGALITENQYNWAFPIYAPNEVIRYNRGWENRYLKAYGEWRFHLGIDFGCLHLGGNEAEIYAVDDGVVSNSLEGCTANGDIDTKIAQCRRLDSRNGTYGNFVMIDHKQYGETRTVYAHLAQGSVRVKKGDTVKKGQLIGLCGDTGSSVGRHLHFEVWEGHVYSDSLVDPHAYIGISHFKKCPVGTQTQISKGC